MKKNIIRLASLVVGIFLMASTFGYAATVSFEIKNTDLLPGMGWDNGVEAFIWGFDYSGTTSVSVTSGDAMSSWFTSEAQDKPSVNTWQIEAVDMTFNTPLTSGTILTIEFDGTIDWIAANPWEFRDNSNNTITDIRMISSNLNDGGKVIFSAVPIPGAVFLFGSALLGLFGIRRKIKN